MKIGFGTFPDLLHVVLVVLNGTIFTHLYPINICLHGEGDVLLKFSK